MINFAIQQNIEVEQQSNNNFIYFLTLHLTSPPSRSSMHGRLCEYSLNTYQPYERECV